MDVPGIPDIEERRGDLMGCDLIYTKEKYLAKINAKSFKLSIDDVINKICINNLQSINTLYDLNLKLIDKEAERMSALDSKGSNVFGMAGVALALIFSLGGLLIEKIENRPLFFTDRPVEILTALYMITVFLLLTSVLFALFAVKARSDIKTVTDSDIFTTAIDKEDEVVYKRYLIAHYWLIYQNNFLINELKGRWLKWAYRFFAMSMVFLLVISFIIGFYSIGKAQSIKDKSKIISKEDRKMTDENIPANITQTTPAPEQQPAPKPTPKPSSGTNQTVEVIIIPVK